MKLLKYDKIDTNIDEHSSMIIAERSRILAGFQAGLFCL
jgi:hypothetical protein